MDLTVAFILGEILSTIITSIVTDLLSPLIVLAFGKDIRQLQNMFIYLRCPSVCKTDHKNYAELGCNALNTPQLAQGIEYLSPYIKEAGGVTWNWGRFMQTTINFILVVITLFLLVRSYFKIFKEEKARMRECPSCFIKIDERATRCGYCTSQCSPTIKKVRGQSAMGTGEIIVGEGRDPGVYSQGHDMFIEY
jgi:large conductance mechanosensitive channel